MQTVTLPSKKGRYLHIDLLRILAAFLVVYNHTAGFHYYLTHTNSPYKLVAAIGLSALTRINVPLFFMLSGALLLKKEESYRALFSKRILRFCLVLVAFSALSYSSTHILYHHDLSLTWFIHALVSCEISEPYWFLYAYLGFLFALPFLRKVANHLTRQDMLLLILFRVIFVSVAAMGKYGAGCLGYTPVSVYEKFSLPFAAVDILFYPLLGFFLEHRIPAEKLGKKEVILLMALLVCCIGTATGFTWHQGLHQGKYTQSYLGLLVCISAPCVYLLVKALCFRLRENAFVLRTGKAAGKLSELTLGIYLLDPMFKSFFAEKILSPAGESLALIPLSLVYCCISIAVCGSITLILKRLPFIRKIL